MSVSTTELFKSWQATEKTDFMTLVVESEGRVTSYVEYRSGYGQELVTRQPTLEEIMKFNDLSKFGLSRQELATAILGGIAEKIHKAVKDNEFD